MDMTNASLITICWELYEQGIPKSHIAKKLGKHRETIYLWIKASKRYGLMGFLDRYHQAKKGARKKRRVNPIFKRWVWEIREREYDCCGQKIQYFLKKEHHIHICVPKIYEILSEKYIIRPKWKKNQKRGKVPKATGPRQVVQMDSMDFGDLFAFTAIDIFTKEANILLSTELTGRFGCEFLYQSMRRRFGHVCLIQTDGGPEFKADFVDNVYLFCDRYRIARPYRKNEQSYIESFNRTLRKECLGWNKYEARDIDECRKLVEDFLKRYHYHRPHMGLKMRPPLSEKEEHCRIFTEN